ncbi:MAG: hypothetical protein IPI35_03165 [Deltaproteobacteria bacterium]|nr:hypothetical protein [Deltaproteobacteria bacterium]
MAIWSPLQDALQERLDVDLLTSIYGSVSLSAGEIRRELEAEGLVYYDPTSGQSPELFELDRSAEALIARSRSRAGYIGAAGAFAGAAGVPPELVASLVHLLRLGQRLAVVYGLDPESEAGQLALRRALAAAFELPLPEPGGPALRVRDLPAVITQQLPAAPQAVGWAVRATGDKLVSVALRRVMRLVPGLSVASSTLYARRSLGERAARLQAVLRRTWTGEPLDDATEAEVVPPQAKSPSTG